MIIKLLIDGSNPHCVLSQLADQPVFKAQPVDTEDDENI